MGSAFVRPRVSDLHFQVFSRALHPELFDILATRRVNQHGHNLAVHITPAGHLLSWERGSVHIEELTTTSRQILPDCGRRIGYRLAGERSGRCEFGRGLRYQFSAQVEVLPPELFLHVHEEIRTDGERKGLLFHFCPHNRLALSPIGVVIAEALPRCLAVSSFHTFPDECAVLKTQSLIEEV